MRKEAVHEEEKEDGEEGRRSGNVRHIIPISGKDSLATAIVQMAREPSVPYEFIYNDTRAELPETYAWIEKVEQKLGITITRAGKSLVNIIYEQRCLPSNQRRFCTRMAKIYPMHDFIGKDNATIYIGIRADEERKGAQEHENISVVYPLKDMGINLPMVYRIVQDRGLMPPSFFWRRLYLRVRQLLGKQAHVIGELPQWSFDRAFAWRSRPNCYFCFYQRLYEWVGLLEHHPELFSDAEQVETVVGHGDGEDNEPFYWNRNYPLRRIRDEAERIFEDRVNALCKIFNAMLQKELWTETLADGIDLTQTSCGLYCGK